MKLTIDNLDGRGVVDYSAALSADSPMTIRRVLNAPSRCTGSLVVGSPNPGSVPAFTIPARLARVVVGADDGTLLFTGYLATEPVAIYAGAGLAGPVYRAAFTAISDDWLLDKQTLTLRGNGFAQPGGTLLETLTARIDASLFTTADIASSRPVGIFEPQPTEPWSTNASAIAGSTYSAYRVVDSALSLQPVGAVTHTLNFDTGNGGALQVSALSTAMVKELANDVTLSGRIEPTAYVQEMFAGDGTTALFTLTGIPFRPATSSLMNDPFDEAVIDSQLWNITDPGSHLRLGSRGLTMSGGTGLDGQTTLAAIDLVEMGGSLLLESGRVLLTSPSDGVIGGLYDGPVQRGNCIAGYNVRQRSGTTVITPFVSGVEAGTTYTALPGHRYTLRIRLHSVEPQRVLQSYYARVDGAIQEFGGGSTSSAMALVFDLQDLGDASNTPATVLYDGTVPTSPASCTFAAVDSVELNGSIGFCKITQGSLWIVSTLPGGAPATRLLGIAGEGVDCIEATDKVTFLAGRIPAAGEIVTILYRTRGRSVARLQNAASVAAEASSGVPGTARWLGEILKPAARSSNDCEAAAQAVLALASSRSAAIAGNYTVINPEDDIWPGDVLDITTGGQNIDVIVRKVDVLDGHAAPELLTYRIAFANDWAESLGLTLSESIAADTLLPQTALLAPAQGIANLQQLTVIEATSTALQIDAGANPPASGGFEVRARDGDFGPRVDQDLVLRSPVRSFSIPRAAQVERYYVRMYDGSTPPLYSRVSSAIFINLPVS